MDKKSAPIAVFDSGMGGISVFSEIYRLMPNENYIFFGDSKNAPYGTKTVDQVREMTINITGSFIDRGAKAVVIACNTATSAAINDCRQRYTGVPIIGIEPALKPAVLSDEYPSVLVLATDLTLREKKFVNLLNKYKDEAKIYTLAAPGIVELVEGDNLDSQESYDYFEGLLSPYRDKNMDCVVLGCTHFPFAKENIRKVVGEHVRFYDGGEGTAREVRRLLDREGCLSDSKRGSIVFENSDESMINLSKRLFELQNGLQ